MKSTDVSSATKYRCGGPRMVLALDVSVFFFFSSRRRHTRFDCDWSSDVCSSDLEDVEWLRGVVTMHMELTGSPVAERILSNWWINVERFAKIFPKDYKRVLEAQQIGRASCRERV